MEKRPSIRDGLSSNSKAIGAIVKRLSERWLSIGEEPMKPNTFEHELDDEGDKRQGGSEGLGAGSERRLQPLRCERSQSDHFLICLSRAMLSALWRMVESVMAK